MNKISVASLLLALLAFACHPKKDPLLTGFEGKPMPSFNLLLTDSSTYINTENIPSGEPTVLFYFSPHCPYCKAQTEDIINHINLFRGIRIYMFTTWTFQELRSFKAKYNIDKYKNIVIGIDYKNFFKTYYSVEGVPYIATFNKNKVMIHAFLGIMYANQIKSDINS